MKKFVVLVSIILAMSLFSFCVATESDATAQVDTTTGADTTYYYNNDSGELVESNEYDLDEDAVLLDSEEDLGDLYDGQESADEEETQEELMKAFLEQKEEIASVKDEETDKKFVVTKVLSDIKTQYVSESYYVYIIKYQLLNIRVEDDEIPAVAILSYDISDNKNLKPLQVGDTLYGYVERVSKEDSTYGMINHGLKDSEIAYVSVSSQDRTLGIILLAIFTILLVGLYTGKKGLKLLIPAFVALDMLFIVFVPELEIGRNVLAISSAIALELMILITVLKNGWSRKTVVALLSSIVVVVLIATFAGVFGNANGFTGKGFISEERYDLSSNVYYIDSLLKSTISVFDLYISVIVVISSIVVSLIASNVADIVEKYAGTEGMVNSIIEEAKGIVAEYPLILAGIFMVVYLPEFMLMKFNHETFETIINSEVLVTNFTIGAMVIISSLIIAPITAIVGYLFMGKVEVKQIEE